MDGKHDTQAARSADVLLASAALLVALTTGCRHPTATTQHEPGPLEQQTYDTGVLKPVDSSLNVAVGQEAPDFQLPATDGTRVRLSDYRGRKNVLLSFVPAAWTPVCSSQWPLYNALQETFVQTDTQLIGITTDNTPTQFAWCRAMGGVWFPVLSDFNPHGKVCTAYGVLRSDGTSERALFLVDKKGVIRYIDVQDINEQPELDPLLEALGRLDTTPAD